MVVERSLPCEVVPLTIFTTYINMQISYGEEKHDPMVRLWRPAESSKTSVHFGQITYRHTVRHSLKYFETGGTRETLLDAHQVCTSSDILLHIGYLLRNWDVSAFITFAAMVQTRNRNDSHTSFHFVYGICFSQAFQELSGHHDIDAPNSDNVSFACSWNILVSLFCLSVYCGMIVSFMLKLPQRTSMAHVLFYTATVSTVIVCFVTWDTLVLSFSHEIARIELVRLAIDVRRMLVGIVFLCGMMLYSFFIAKAPPFVQEWKMPRVPYPEERSFWTFFEPGIDMCNIFFTIICSAIDVLRRLLIYIINICKKMRLL